jgi:hypothetical protein
MKTAEEAAAYLRAEEQRRCNEIRNIPITSINDKPIMVDHSGLWPSSSWAVCA